MSKKPNVCPWLKTEQERVNAITEIAESVNFQFTKIQPLSPEQFNYLRHAFIIREMLFRTFLICAGEKTIYATEESCQFVIREESGKIIGKTRKYLLFTYIKDTVFYMGGMTAKDLTVYNRIVNLVAIPEGGNHE